MNESLIEIPEDVPELHAVRCAWVINATKRQYVPWPSARHQHIAGIRGSIRDFAVTRALENAVSPVWAEFGVENGVSANYWITRLPEDGRLLLFDSFEGLPEAWNSHKEAGGRKALAVPTWDDARVEMYPGWFEDVLPGFDMPVLGFVHVDCDVYSSTRTVLQHLNVVPGSVILFDELFGYEGYEQGELKALSEWDRKFRFIAKDTYSRAAIEIL